MDHAYKSYKNLHEKRVPTKRVRSSFVSRFSRVYGATAFVNVYEGLLAATESR